jgi:Tfp pilus assembly protein PilN
MIKVNLLPPEYRVVEGTPVARLAVTITGVVLVAAAAGYWGYVHMGVLAQVRDERIQKEEELASLKAQAERSQALLKEFKEYQRRRETIEKIGAQRILWSRKLDEFADLVNNKGDTKRHLVWLSTIRTQSGRLPISPICLNIHGWSAGDMSRKLSDFNSDIKNSEDFFADCFRVDPPEGGRVDFNDENVPKQAWEFTFGIDFKQPNWRDKP